MSLIKGSVEYQEFTTAIEQWRRVAYQSGQNTQQFLFGVTKEKITKKEGIRRDKIARKFGGNFVGPINIRGNENKGWFCIKNSGEPFNSRRAAEILEACGL